MKKILIIFAHPVLEKSRVHKTLLQYISRLDHVTFNDLYENYPDFDIDVKREQQLLLSHDIIIWQFPLYWYSAPALLKQWQDLVLEHGWAYGKNGTALSGKKIFNLITSGGGMQAYQPDGYQHCTMNDLLRPYERTAALCLMAYWPPFWIPGTHKLDLSEIKEYGEKYRQLLIEIGKGNLTDDEMVAANCINDLIEISKSNPA